VIKTIRTFTGLGLKEAKDLAESTGWHLSGVHSFDCGQLEDFIRELEAQGANLR
jgi:ribosomal protein L7/L12